MTKPVGLDGDGAGSDVAAAEEKSGGVYELVKVLFQALLIAIVVRTFLFQPFNIPSGSMIPTLLVGDFLFVSKYSYGYSRFSLPSIKIGTYDVPFGSNLFQGRIMASTPKRGDVIVFKLPSNNSTDYIKRLIGLPGDTIQVKQGRLYINDTLVPREPIAKVTTPDRFDHEGPVPTYKETLPGGVSHTIIELNGDQGYMDNTEPYKVPPNSYFMMGDNRDNSTDSRVPPDQGGVGFVPFDNLVGRAEVIFFSVRDDESAWKFWKWPWTVRWNRMFTRVH